MVVLATHEWPPSSTDAGAGAPVAVLVHGVTGWWRTWWRVGPALAQRGWRVVAVDLRGHGNSPPIDGVASVADWAADVAEVIRARGGRADALIGHSLGAAVSVELAYVHPDLVRGIVLEDPPALTRTDDLAWHAGLERELVAATTDPDAEIARQLRENPAWLEEDARQDVEGKALADREGILASFRRDTGARVAAVAPELRVPALYLLAAEDRSVFVGEPRRRLEAQLPSNARLQVIDAGHTIHRDCFEDYIGAVLSWIEKPLAR